MYSDRVSILITINLCDPLLFNQLIYLLTYLHFIKLKLVKQLKFVNDISLFKWFDESQNSVLPDS